MTRHAPKEKQVLQWYFSPEKSNCHLGPCLRLLFFGNLELVKNILQSRMPYWARYANARPSGWIVIWLWTQRGSGTARLCEENSGFTLRGLGLLGRAMWRGGAALFVIAKGSRHVVILTESRVSYDVTLVGEWPWRYPQTEHKHMQMFVFRTMYKLTPCKIWARIL